MILFSVLMIVSCASTSNATDEASIKAKEFNKVSDKGVVYIYRPNRMFAAALSTNKRLMDWMPEEQVLELFLDGN